MGQQQPNEAEEAEENVKATSITGEFAIQAFNPSATMAISDANRIRLDVGRVLIESINHPDRYPIGTVGFLDTKFIGRAVARILKTEEHPDDCLLDEVDGIDESTLEKVQSKMGQARRSRLLEMSQPEMVDRFELTAAESHQLRLALLGLAGASPAPEQRWARAAPAVVPDVVGQSLGEAGRAIRSARLSMGTLHYEDSEQIRDTVLQQSSLPGTELPSRTRLNLRVASGATVLTPDIVGKPLNQGRKLLREAGLQSRPKIVFAVAPEQPKDHIVEVIPKSGTSITPHGHLTIRVSQGPAPGVSDGFTVWGWLLIGFVIGSALTALIYFLVTRM